MRSDKLSRPWTYTPEEFIDGMLFHGSCERWRSPVPRPGGYDGCFWTASVPLIAQVYIPEWGGKAFISLSRYNLDEGVRPGEHSFAWRVAEQLGASAEILAADPGGTPTSWRITGTPVTNRSVMQYLMDLGYESSEPGDFRAWIKTVEQNVPVRHDATPYGRLIMIDPLPGMRVYSLSDDEGDLTDPQYHKIQTFSGAFEAGFDAVKIGDHCQSPAWGNVGHDAWGFSAASIQGHYEQGRTLCIAATHRDWGDKLQGSLTPDITNWHFGQVVQAIMADQPVPDVVVQAHEELFHALLSKPLDTKLLVPTFLDPESVQNLENWPRQEGLVAEFQTRIKRADPIEGVAVIFTQRMDSLTFQNDEHAIRLGSLIHACHLEGVVLPIEVHMMQKNGELACVADLQNKIECLQQIVKARRMSDTYT